MIYAGTKDGESYGFYLDQDGLQNAVELTDEEHMTLMDGQASGKAIVFHLEKKPTLENAPEPTTEELSAQARTERDRFIGTVEWRLRRYENQNAAGIPTIDTEETYKKLLAYVQALRDVPEQYGFPASIIWPELQI